MDESRDSAAPDGERAPAPPGVPDLPEPPIAPPAARPKKPGIRVGPFVFVPELGRTSADDPWAHRKGEPRVFALLWSMYLMLSAMLTIFGVRSLGLPMATQFHFGVRAMLVMTALGCCVLWPLTRLSQAPPARARRATLADLLIVLLPVQAVVWPMPFLTGWPFGVAGGIAAMLSAWTVLAGVGVLHGAASRSGWDRAAWMVFCVGVVGAGPALELAASRTVGAVMPGWWRLLSPFTAVVELTDSRGGLRPAMTPLRWWLCVAPGLGLVGYFLPVAGGSGGRGPRRVQ